MLCLDGGGIRGLVLIQLLRAIEEVTGRPIRNCFDWIGGTSTGGILALAIVHGQMLSIRCGCHVFFILLNSFVSIKRWKMSALCWHTLRLALHSGVGAVLQLPVSNKSDYVC